MVAAEVMDGAVVRRWCRMAADALGSARSAIDALNVYPVPDSDTGTNLYRTLRSAADAVDMLAPGAGPEEVWRAAADGAMLGACGNSGIIVSQLLRGLSDVCAPASPCDGTVVARALGHAAGLARSAVSRPVEGTVLTVADAAARAAVAAVAGAAVAKAVAGGAAVAGAVAGGAVAGAAAAPDVAGAAGAPVDVAAAGALAGRAGPAGAQLAAVVLAAGAAARQARDLTTGQLAVLAASGVVDAGAAGLCVVLDAWAAAISGTHLTALDVPGPAAPRTAQPPAGPAAPSAESYGYEVTYLLEAEPGAVAQLREQLDSMGDSLVIAGGPPLASGPPSASGPSASGPSASGPSASGLSASGPGASGLSASGPGASGLSASGPASAASPAAADRPALWSVHVHVPEAGAAIEAGLRAGSLRRITVTYLGAPPPARHRVVAICDTPGMAALAESAGARPLRFESPFPAVAELSALIRQAAAPARRCIVVPSGPSTAAAAAAAARDLAGDGIDVRVVAVASPVQALPALAVHEPAAGFAADAAAMSRAASRMRWSAISCDPAAGSGPGAAGVVQDGPAAGSGPGAAGVAPDDAAGTVAAALAATDKLLAGGAELVTLLTGGQAAEHLAELVTARVRELTPAAEIECHAGAVAGHALLVGVE